MLKTHIWLPTKSIFQQLKTPIRFLNACESPYKICLQPVFYRRTVKETFILIGISTQKCAKRFGKSPLSKSPVSFFPAVFSCSSMPYRVHQFYCISPIQSDQLIGDAILRSILLHHSAIELIIHIFFPEQKKMLRKSSLNFSLSQSCDTNSVISSNLNKFYRNVLV